MKKVLYNEIDGFKIIAGFANMIVDPVATNRKVNKKFENCEEFKTLKKHSDEFNNHLKMQYQAADSFKLAEKKNNKLDMGKYKTEYYSRVKKAEEVQEQLKKIEPLIKEARLKIYKENEVYFEPSKNEIHVEDNEFDILSGLFSKNSIVSIDGDIVIDYRDVYYSKQGKKWTKHEIENLGFEPESEWIKKSVLSDIQIKEIQEQFEQERIAALSKDEKELESENLKKQALSESVYMRSELEILGDSKALTKSQKFYNNKCAEIDAAYGI